MNCVIVVKSKKKPELIENVILDNETKAGSKIEWKENKYLVKEIVIYDYDEEMIYLFCTNITNNGKRKLLTTTWS